MYKRSINWIPFFATRDFICWRDREFDDNKYPCIVNNIGGDGVLMELGIDLVLFTNHVAQEVARCMYDAVLVTVGNKAQFLPTPAKRECVLLRSYWRGESDWVYKAEGTFAYREVGAESHYSELYADGDSTSSRVMVNTIEEYGIELVFEFMCYSFSMLDAVWLANALMQASGGNPRDSLETRQVNSSGESLNGSPGWPF